MVTRHEEGVGGRERRRTGEECLGGEGQNGFPYPKRKFLFDFISDPRGPRYGGAVRTSPWRRALPLRILSLQEWSGTPHLLAESQAGSLAPSWTCENLPSSKRTMVEGDSSCDELEFTANCSRRSTHTSIGTPREPWQRARHYENIFRHLYSHYTYTPVAAHHVIYVMHTLQIDAHRRTRVCDRASYIVAFVA